METNATAHRFALAAVMAFVFFLLFYGICIGGFVYKEPDICWLLASGRWIVEHGHLPSTDPFSYTTHYHGAKYVIEKWLTEVIFYEVFAVSGVVGLLVFDAFLLGIAFFVMPMRILYLSGLRGRVVLLITSLTALTSLSHLYVRPEVFSMVIAGIFVEVLLRVSKSTAGNTKVDWKAIFILSVLTCLWSNLHTLFLVAILLTAMYTGCQLIEKLFISSLRQQSFNATIPIALICCVLSSLANPYGVGLWLYLPEIFGPFTQTNNEMQPIKFSTALSLNFIPFYIFAITGLLAVIKNFKSRLHVPLKQGDLFFLSLIPAGIAGGLKTIRSIPLAALLFTGGYSRAAGNTISIQKPEFFKAIDERLDALTNPLQIAFPLICTAIVGLGAFLITFAVEPELPQGSAAFAPPVEAVKYIGQNRPHGNQLNDPHFGNVLMWQLKDAPPVFIDSRYNLFGNDLLQDYWKMVNCNEGWEKLLDKYQIEWVFIPPKLPLSKQLAVYQGAAQKKTGDWKLLYEDKASSIYARNQNNPR